MDTEEFCDTPGDDIDEGSEEETPFFFGYNENRCIKKSSEHSILEDLSSYPLPDEIKKKADMIFGSMKYNVHRGKIRQQLLFYCVYCAHLELRMTVQPFILGELFNLKRGDVQKCNSIFSAFKTGYNPPAFKTNPKRYIPIFSRSMDLSDEATQDALILADRILKIKPSLIESNSQTVAAGVLRYYMKINGINTSDTQKIATVTGKSRVTIDNMARHIETLDNDSS
jgi:transcription initiation factor TFIIIB Brf1 subunit/transcription initiation factor TFIIB